MKKQYKEKGFTLLEVTLALVLFSILLSSAFMVFEHNYKSYIDFQNNTNLLEDSRMVMEFIQEEVRVADYVKFNITPDPGVDPTLLKYYYLISLSRTDEVDVTGATTGKKILEMHIQKKDDAPSVYGGSGKLNYEGVVIADNVKYILINEADTLLPELECTLKDKIGSSKEAELTSKLRISLKYKKIT